jgi:hypothetical protein
MAKLNKLQQASAEDVRSYEQQLQTLRAERDSVQTAAKSCQEQLYTLQAAAAATDAMASSPSGVVDGSCSIGVDALREYIMCALCQQPMLDAVVCRYAAG